MDRKTSKSSSRVVSRVSSRIGSQSGSRAGSSMSSSNSHSKFLPSRSSRSFMGSKSNLFSSSKKNLASESLRFQKPVAQILDEFGEDVTPQSLLPQEQTSVRKNQSNMLGTETGPPTDSLFQYSIYGTGTSYTQPFSKSMFSSSATDAGTSVQGSMSDAEEIVRGPAPAKPAEPPSQVHTVHEEEPEILTAEDLEKQVHITLTETEMIWMLDIPGTCVAGDSEEAEEVKKRNEQYSELVKNRPGNDRYSDRGMQTINDAPKTKQVQTDAIICTDTGMNASIWDMYDTYEALKEGKDEGGKGEETLEGLSTRAASRMTSKGTSRATSRAPTAMGYSAMTSVNEGSTVSGSIFTASMMTDVTMHSNVPSAVEKEEEQINPTQPNDHPILKLESLRDSLRIAERAVTHNIFQQKQALYRDLPVLIDPDHPPTALDSLVIQVPHLEKLWAFTCPLTKKRTITCLSWNPVNKDIIAVGYGTFSASDKTPGLICCWSLKNPEYPERIFHSPCGVTSLGFSYMQPNLLAAGLYSGNVVLYNARSAAHESVLDSRDALHRHSAPVWQVSWVIKEHSMGERKAEVLVSTSVDGRILQWSIRKGFESNQLMKLKRMVTPKPQKKTTKSKHSHSHVNTAPAVGQGEAYISQHAPGMGFDFWPKDSNVYLACTEEGYVHKCSCSYNEQVLETYVGHTGPVYKVRWSPFLSDIFLTCSADWTTKLWHQDHTTPLYSFHAAQKSIYDVCWAPFDSTLFGCVSEGRIEIWNLQHSVHDPLFVHSPISGAKQTCIAFAYDTEVVLVGDSEGAVSVYLLKNTPSPPTDQADSLRNIVNSSKLMDLSSSL